MSKRKQHLPDFKSKVALEALKGEQTVAELASRFGPPEIMNTDRDRSLRHSPGQIACANPACASRWAEKAGSSPHRLQANVCRAMDKIFVERLWRSLKYECVYLHTWETGSEAKAGVGKGMDFYNQKRPHSTLGGKPPAVVYWLRREKIKPDQQAQRVAQFTPKPVQGLGSSSDAMEVYVW